MMKFDTTVQIKYNWARHTIGIPTSKYSCPSQFRNISIYRLFKSIYFAVPTIYKIKKW